MLLLERSSFKYDFLSLLYLESSSSYTLKNEINLKFKKRGVEGVVDAFERAAHST
jgi:hypothetical protein